MTILVGNILFGRYRIDEFIGQGLCAEVYRAYSIETEKIYALKVLQSERVDQSTFQDYKERFRLEKLLSERLIHRNIAEVHEFHVDEKAVAIAMEYFPSGSLADKIVQAKENGLEIPIADAERIIHDVAEGLSLLHKNDVIHRNIKPSNILVAQDGTAKIADLGYAQSPESRIGRYGLGSLSIDHPGAQEYMPPEQQPGQKMALRASADVYAFGCVLFEILTGRVYFHQKPGTQARELRADVPLLLDNLLKRMLSVDAEQRPWNGDEISQELKVRDEKKDAAPKRSIGKHLRQYWYVWTIIALIVLAWFGLNNISISTPEKIQETTAVVLVPTDTETPVPPTDTPSPTNTLTTTPTSTLTPTVTITPSITPTSTTTPIIGLIKYSSTNIRYGPGTNYPIITKLDKDAEVDVIGRGLDGTWVVIRFPDNTQGWVSSDLVSVENAVSEMDDFPIPPTPVLYRVTLINNINPGFWGYAGAKGPFGTAIIKPDGSATFSIPEGEYELTLCDDLTSYSTPSNPFQGSIIKGNCREPVTITVTGDMELLLTHLIPEGDS